MPCNEIYRCSWAALKSHKVVFLCQVEGEEIESLSLPKGHKRKGDGWQFLPDCHKEGMLMLCVLLSYINVCSVQHGKRALFMKKGTFVLLKRALFSIKKLKQFSRKKLFFLSNKRALFREKGQFPTLKKVKMLVYPLCFNSWKPYLSLKVVIFIL